MEITPEQIESWRELRVEVCMFIKKNDFFWLVPAYTDKDRVEISVDDFLVLAPKIKLLLEAFPDAKIATVIKPKELIK
jgi:hypothetical protein